MTPYYKRPPASRRTRVLYTHVLPREPPVAILWLAPTEEFAST